MVDDSKDDSKESRECGQIRRKAETQATLPLLWQKHGRSERRDLEGQRNAHAEHEG